MARRKPMRIAKEQALEAYNNPKTKILFELYYPTFEDYWRECEKLNNMSEEEYQTKVGEAREKLKLIREIRNRQNG